MPELLRSHHFTESVHAATFTASLDMQNLTTRREHVPLDSLNAIDKVRVQIMDVRQPPANPLIQSRDDVVNIGDQAPRDRVREPDADEARVNSDPSSVIRSKGLASSSGNRNQLL